MIKITKSNMEELIKDAVDVCKKNDYSEECFSCSDIRLKHQLDCDLDSIMDKIEEKGINLEKHFDGLFKSLIENNEDEPDDFEIFVYCETIERFLPAKWIIEGNIPPVKTEFYTELETGYPRFKYQKWDTSKEAIDALLKESIAANSFIDIANEIAIHYRYPDDIPTISSLECLKDMYADKIDDIKDNEKPIDCSSFLVELSYSKDENHSIVLLIKAGGFHDDMIIGKKYKSGHYSVDKLIPLKGINPLDVRDYSDNLLKKFEDYIKDYDGYRNQL